MRRDVFQGTSDQARAAFTRARAVHVASVASDGSPILRTVNAILMDDAVVFHGARAGEKMAGLGGPAVVSAAEEIAAIPSWFFGEQRACPATTYYLGAQGHGRLEEVTDLERKAAFFRAFMAKYQPEGRHVPITADAPLYRKALEQLLVAEVRLERVAAKVKVGQNRTMPERVRVLEQLWARGAPGDARAIARILALCPEIPAPAFLCPRGRPLATESLAPPPSPELRMLCHLEDDELEDAARLLEKAQTYWLSALTPRELHTSLARSPARVGARDARGRLVGFARATSDGKLAWLYDVVTHPEVRGQGVGTEVVRLLLDHPEVRGCRHVMLGTRDATVFYERLGFRDVREAPRWPWPTITMIRSRDGAA